MNKTHSFDSLLLPKTARASHISLMKSLKAVFSPSQDLFISYVYTLFLGIDLWCPNPKSVSLTWLSPAWASPHIQFLFSQPRDLLKVLLSFSTVSARIARCCYGRISPKSGFIVLVYLFLLILTLSVASSLIHSNMF